MPWQQYVADVALEIDPATGILAYREVIVHVMRQQGKTTLQLPVITHRCISPDFDGPQQATYAAQSGVAARQKLLDEHWPLLAASPLGRMCKPRRQSGHEAILWNNGSRHGITTGTEKAGHGLTLDLPVIDEAFAYRDSRLEQAFVPAMQTRPNAQLWIMSTAGNAGSIYLRSKVTMGRAHVDTGSTNLIAYFEWSFTEDEDPYDPDTWWRRMPALGRTTGEREIAAAAASMDPREFLRAFGNRWLDDEDSASPIPAEAWGACADLTGALAGRVSFGLAVADDQSHALIAVAGVREDGLRQVEIIDNRSGTTWIPDRLTQLVADHDATGIALNPTGPSGALLSELRERRINIIEVLGREWAQACGELLKTVTENRLRHRNDEVLNAAVHVARTRPASDAWVFSQRDSLSGISPLIAATLALHLHAVRGPEVYDPLDSVW